jgi:hypothetical protein
MSYSTIHAEVLKRAPVGHEEVGFSTIGDRLNLPVAEVPTHDRYDDEGDNQSIVMSVGDPLAIRIDHPHKILKTMGISSKGGKDSLTSTLHYIFDEKTVVPYRTKIETGPQAGNVVTHMPNLNYIRSAVFGASGISTDCTSAIVEEVVKIQQTGRRSSFSGEWAEENLIPIVERCPSTRLDFGSRWFLDFGDGLIEEMDKVDGYSFGGSDADRLVDMVIPPMKYLPTAFSSYTENAAPMNHLWPLYYRNFSEWNNGTPIEIPNLPPKARFMTNPTGFPSTLNFLDRLPFTDVNVDILMTVEKVHHFVNSGIYNRYSGYSLRNLGNIEYDEQLELLFPIDVLRWVVMEFSRSPGFHWQVAYEIETRPIKMKIVKTIGEEASVFIYDYASDEKAAPICGAYFDISLVSLAPTSIMDPSISVQRPSQDDRSFILQT